MIECVRFRGRKRRINIPQEISVKYNDFGLFLLEDENRQRVKAIVHKHINDAEEINKEILEQWITGRGMHPVTWKTLTEVLRDIELITLAQEIEAVKCHEEAIEDVPVGVSVNAVQRDPTKLQTAEDPEQRSNLDVSTTGMEYT